MTGRSLKRFSRNSLGSCSTRVLVRQGQGLGAGRLTGSPDCMTSPNSTAVYPEPKLRKLLSYVKDIKHVGGDYGFSACVVGKSNQPIPSNISEGLVRSLDEFHQQVTVPVRLSSGYLTSVLSSILPFYELLRSEGGSPHQ